jgi:hypothetical protein
VPDVLVEMQFGSEVQHPDRELQTLPAQLGAMQYPPEHVYPLAQSPVTPQA